MEPPIYYCVICPSSKEHSRVGSNPLYCYQFIVHQRDVPSHRRVAPCCYRAIFVQGCEGSGRGPNCLHVWWYLQAELPRGWGSPPTSHLPVFCERCKRSISAYYVHHSFCRDRLHSTPASMVTPTNDIAVARHGSKSSIIRPDHLHRCESVLHLFTIAASFRIPKRCDTAITPCDCKSIRSTTNVLGSMSYLFQDSAEFGEVSPNYGSAVG